MGVVEVLGSVDWRGLGVRLVIVHGSVLRGRNPRDVDLVVLVGSDVEVDDVVVRIMEVVENSTGIEADVYVIKDPNDVNCFLLWEALRSGVIIYIDAVGREGLIKVINICYDFMLSREKVRYTETLIKQVMGSAS